jgi:hypothetical protein
VLGAECDGGVRSGGCEWRAGAGVAVAWRWDGRWDGRWGRLRGGVARISGARRRRMGVVFEGREVGGGRRAQTALWGGTRGDQAGAHGGQHTGGE